MMMNRRPTVELVEARAKMAMSSDGWLREYDSCERLSREILEKLDEKDRLTRLGKPSSQVIVTVRPLLKKLDDGLSSLRQNLIKNVTSGLITSLEGERRQLMLDNLVSKAAQLQMTATGRKQNVEGPQRTSLLGNDFGRPMSATVSWNDEDVEANNVSVGDVQTQQKRILQEQDEGLEALSSVIARQKRIAYAIGEEADLHNELIDDIAEHVDGTRERLLKETRHVQIVTRKSGTCGLWMVVLLLLLAIVVIVAIPWKK